MKNKIILLLIIVSMLFQNGQVFAETGADYTSGLIPVGSTFNRNSTSNSCALEPVVGVTTAAIVDRDISTTYVMASGWALTYVFPSPIEMTGYKLSKNTGTDQNPRVQFYNSAGVSLYESGNLATNTGYYDISLTLSDVKYACINKTTNGVGTIKEFNVFGTAGTVTQETPVLSEGIKTDTTITLSWTGDGDTYDVYKDGVKQTTNTTAKTVTYTGLSPSTAYDFYVVSHKASVSDTTSNTLTVTTNTLVHDVPVITLEGKTDQYITISWTGNGSTYDVYKDGVKVNSDITDKAVSFTALDADTEYEFYVVSKKLGDTKTSSVLAVTTDDEPPIETHNTPVLTSSNITDTSVKLNFTNGNGDSYDIYQGSTKIASDVSGTLIAYTVTNLSPGQTYSFHIVSKKQGDTKTSNTISVTCLTSSGGGDDPDDQVDNEGMLDFFINLWTTITSILNTLLVVANTLDNLEFDQTLLPYFGIVRYVIGDYNYLILSGVFLISLGIYMWKFTLVSVDWLKSILPWTK